MRDLATPRLALEPQVVAHADAMFALLQDPAIYRYENEPPSSLEWLRERFLRLESRTSADGSEQWLNWVVRRKPSQVIGFVQATVRGGTSAGIAYVLGSAYWGRGFASEAVQAMLVELGGHYGVNAFSAVLKRGNARSMRVLERLGFTPAPPAARPLHEAADDEIVMECR